MFELCPYSIKGHILGRGAGYKDNYHKIIPIVVIFIERLCGLGGGGMEWWQEATVILTPQSDRYDI